MREMIRAQIFGDGPKRELENANQLVAQGEIVPFLVDDRLFGYLDPKDPNRIQEALDHTDTVTKLLWEAELAASAGDKTSAERLKMHLRMLVFLLPELPEVLLDSKNHRPEIEEQIKAILDLPADEILP